MKVERFKLEHHMTQLEQILIAHHHGIPHPSEMPEYGYVVMSDDTIIATAFLRRIEGGFIQLDGLSTNPGMAPHIRNEAIELALSACYSKAKELGYTSILAMSMDSSTLLRSINHGFVRLPHALIVLDLTRKV